MKNRTFQPCCESLESRLTMSGVEYYPIGFIGPLKPGGEIAQIQAGTMTITPTAPNLGENFVCNLTLPTVPNATLTGTTWSYSVVYQGYVGIPTKWQGTYLSTTIYTNFPGTYLVTSVTTYQPMNPSAPPIIVQCNGQVQAPTPTSVTVLTGLLESTTFGSAITASSTVDTSLGQVGPWTGPIAQENIAEFYLPTTGTTMPGTGGWVPNAPASTFVLTNGILYDSISPGGPLWATTPVGDVYCVWTQQLRLAWVFPSFSPGGIQGNYPLDADLNSLVWDIEKTGPTTWELQ